MQVLKPSKRCDECCKFLAVHSKRALVIPFVVSMTVKYLALLAVILATTSAGVGDWYCSLKTKQFSLDRSTHILILSVPFWGYYNGCTPLCGFCYRSYNPLLLQQFELSLQLSLYAKGTIQGVFTQKGTAFSVSVM